MFEVPVKKNEEYIVQITSMGYDGEGIAKINDFTVFIPNAIKEEKVKIKILSVKKNYAYGKLIEILTKSDKRIEPICENFYKCGGCSIQHLKYEYQLEVKRKRVQDCIERIAHIENIKVNDTIGMENPYYYRNKVQIPVGKDKNGNIVMGFYAPRSHNIIDINKCYIQNDISNSIMNLIRNWMEKYNIDPYDEKTRSGIVRHIMIRTGLKTKQVMVVIVTSVNNLPKKSELINLLVDNVQGIHSIIQNINLKNTNVVLGNECKTLWGESFITDYIGKFKFNISPLSFFQVNPIQTETLYKKALEFANLNGDEIVFDAYCGTGTISLFLSQKAKKVYGVEIVDAAIKNAIENAKENNVLNAEFIVGKSEEEIPKLIKNNIIPDVVVVDPPRKGCDEKLIHSICLSSPKRIVYVSCDPATLARDMAIFKTLGYYTKKVQPVDMFAQTGHVETVALMTK